MSYCVAIRSRLETDGYLITETIFAGTFKVTAEKAGMTYVGEAHLQAIAYLALNLSIRDSEQATPAGREAQLSTGS
jgi:hypothetical protein